VGFLLVLALLLWTKEGLRVRLLLVFWDLVGSDAHAFEVEPFLAGVAPDHRLRLVGASADAIHLFAFLGLFQLLANFFGLWVLRSSAAVFDVLRGLKLLRG